MPASKPLTRNKKPGRRFLGCHAATTRPDCIDGTSAIACAITRRTAATAGTFSIFHHERQGVGGYAGDVQNSNDGRVLRIAAGVENIVRRPLDPSRLFAGGRR